MRGEKHTSVENLSALYAILWGIFILNPFVDTFDRNPRLYAPMLELVAFESFWGLIFGFAGFASLILIYTKLIDAAAAVNTVIFTAFAMFLFFGDYTSPGWSLFGLIAIFNFIHWRLSKWKSAKDSNG